MFYSDFQRLWHNDCYFSSFGITKVLFMCIIFMYRVVQIVVEHIINFSNKCVSKGNCQMLVNNQSSPHMQRNQTVDLDLKLSYV